MKTKSVLMLIMCVMAMVNVASAIIVQGINIDFVPIDNAGNGADPATGNLYGAVSYNYSIGKYEITNSQWDAFISTAGAPTGNLSNAYSNSAFWSGSNIPTTGVSWYEAAQFSNYLTSGDKSQGAYQFSGDNNNPGDFLGIDRNTAVSIYGTIYVIPTEDEWYKAAYYTDNSYSRYDIELSTIPAANNGWNYTNGKYRSPWDVGTGTMEQNGTYDMIGNVWEWSEAFIDSCMERLIDPYYIIRGGSYTGTPRWPYWYIKSSYRDNLPAYSENMNVGFRIASMPEPATVCMMVFGISILVLSKRKR